MRPRGPSQGPSGASHPCAQGSLLLEQGVLPAAFVPGDPWAASQARIRAQPFPSPLGPSALVTAKQKQRIHCKPSPWPVCGFC